MYEYNVTVLRVVDGDTLEVYVDLGFKIFKKVTVRLYGIDTPEIRTRDLEEKKAGKIATNRVKQLIESNNHKAVIHSKGIDKYGRCLGVIFVNVKDKLINVNETLLEENLAKKYLI